MERTSNVVNVKEKVFLDRFFEILETLNFPGLGDPVSELKIFLKSLPGVFLVEDELLNNSLAIKGCVVMVNKQKKFRKLDPEKKEARKIHFEFYQVSGKLNSARTWRKDSFDFKSSSCSDVVEKIVDEMCVGDKLMSLGRRKKVKFFSTN